MAPSLRSIPSQSAKKPLDPAKKKKIILGLSIGGAVIVLGVIAAIVIPMILKIDYSSAYRVAKELKSSVSDAYIDDDCYYATKYVSSTYTDEKTYAGYVQDCKNSIGTIAPLITQLAGTEGVKRDNNLNSSFSDFQNTYNKAFPNVANTDAITSIYQTWHKWLLASDGITTDSTDAELQTTANILIDSDNDTLKEYGEGWLEKAKAYITAYRDYYNAKYSDPNKSNLRTAYENAYTAYKNYKSENEPDITDLAGNLADSDGLSEMYKKFQSFYDLLIDTYETNYNSGSGDCTEYKSSGNVYCD